MRRWSGRGGKSGPWPPAPGALRPPPRCPPAQNPLPQPHRERVPLQPLPPAPLILIPPQLGFCFLLRLLPPVAAVRRLDPHGQRGVRREVTPALLSVSVLPPSGAVPAQPASLPRALALAPPAAPGPTRRPPPPCAPSLQALGRQA
jgi:hypothetical protein